MPCLVWLAPGLWAGGAVGLLHAQESRAPPKPRGSALSRCCRLGKISRGRFAAAIGDRPAGSGVLWRSGRGWTQSVKASPRDSKPLLGPGGTNVGPPAAMPSVAVAHKQPGASLQKRALKVQLEVARRTGAPREYLPQMFHRLQQWIGLRTGGSLLLPAQQRTHLRQTRFEPVQQVINRLQGKRQPQRFNGGFDRTTAQ